MCQQAEHQAGTDGQEDMAMSLVDTRKFWEAGSPRNVLHKIRDFLPNVNEVSE